MKTYIKTVMLAVMAGAALTSCEKELEEYSHPDCYLNFYYWSQAQNEALTSDEVTEDMTVATYSFATKPVELKRDTVWLDAIVAGTISDEPRKFMLEQVTVEGADNAKPGVHYVDFKDAQDIYVVDGGKNMVKVGVVLLRDGSLKNETVTLKFRFKDNGVFKPGYSNMTERTIVYTDRLSKPANWDEYYMDYTIGVYGQVKHQLMIEWTGKAWDEDYIVEFNVDQAYTAYMATWFQKKLVQENAARIAGGQDVYREADGTEVSFVPKSWW